MSSLYIMQYLSRLGMKLLQWSRGPLIVWLALGFEIESRGHISPSGKFYLQASLGAQRSKPDVDFH
jgi:hypothetical protein